MLMSATDALGSYSTVHATPQAADLLRRPTAAAQDTAKDTTGTGEAAAPPDAGRASGPAESAEQLARDVGQFFADMIKYMAEGNWEAVRLLLYDGVLQASGALAGNLLKALIYLVVLFVLYRVIDRFLQRILKHAGAVDAGVQGLLLKSYRVVALTFIGAMVLSAVGVNVTALVAGLSIVGIAVGFAARDSLENFIAGVTILLDKPFKVGDYIVVEGHYGQVDEITLRSTRIRSVRNEVMVLPNTQMITTQVVNHTKQNTLRVDIEFGIAYKEYPREAREVVLATLEGDDRILSTPEPTVVVTAMADSSVNMALRFYLRDPSKEVPIRWEYTEKVREALREADIEIPFPHQQLFLDGADGLRESTLFPKPSSNGEGDTES